MCNTFTDNIANDEIYGGFLNANGVKIEQGNEFNPAGNKFTNGGINFNINNALPNQTKYFYYNNSLGDVENPNEVSTTVTKIESGIENECESNFDIVFPGIDGILNSSGRAILLEDHAARLNDLEQLKKELSASTNPDRTARLEQEIVAENRELHRIANMLVKAAILDSTGVDANQFVTWTQKRMDATRYQQLVDFYLGRGALETGGLYLDSVLVQADKVDKTLEREFKDFYAFKRNLLPHIKADGAFKFDATVEHIARDAAENKTGIAQVQGQNILCFFLGECAEAPRLPLSGAREMEEAKDSVFTMAESPLLRIYPNPSDAEITISLDTEARPLTVRIIDGNGELTIEQKLEEPEQSIDISALKTGMYYVLVTDKNGTTHMKKLVKQP